MTRREAQDLARQARHRAGGRNASCAIFRNSFGGLFLTRGHGPQYASNLFRYPGGLVGVYNRRAKVGDIVEDIIAVQGATVAA